MSGKTSPAPMDGAEIERLREFRQRVIGEITFRCLNGAAKRSKSDRRADIGAAVAAVVATEVAITHLDRGAGVTRMSRERKRLVRTLIDARLRYGQLTTGVVDYREITAEKLVDLQRDTADESTLLVIDSWLIGTMASLFVDTSSRRRASALGTKRAEQRRKEAEHHRGEWRKMFEACPDDPPTKDQAAVLIADECHRAQRDCSKATVRDHLKTA